MKNRSLNIYAWPIGILFKVRNMAKDILSNALKVLANAIRHERNKNQYYFSEKERQNSHFCWWLDYLIKCKRKPLNKNSVKGLITELVCPLVFVSPISSLKIGWLKRIYIIYNNKNIHFPGNNLRYKGDYHFLPN